MVEFSVVLVAKQKHDWDGKTINESNKRFMLRVQEACKDLKVNSSIETISQVKGKDDISDNGMNGDYLTPSQIQNHFTLSKNMPPYRKTDIFAFILFSCFYLCFNIIYFVVCLNY